MKNGTAIDLLDNLIGMVEDNQGHDYDGALKMGIEALKKAEEYKWHNLRENPDDLPEIDSRVLFMPDMVKLKELGVNTEYEENVYTGYFHIRYKRKEFNNDFNRKWIEYDDFEGVSTFGLYTPDEVIKWKYIEGTEE